MNGGARALRIAEIGKDLGIPADYGAVRRLKQQREATRLVAIGRDFRGAEFKLAPRAAAAWKKMRAAAVLDGIELLPLSGFRSVNRQVEIIRAKLAAGAGIDSILRLIAAPGYSEHHTGRAIDIGAPDTPPFTEDFAGTAEFCWLKKRAVKFGFHLSY